MPASEIQSADTTLRHHFADMEQQRETVHLRHVDVPGHGDHVLRRPVLRSTWCTGSLYYNAFVEGSQTDEYLAGRDQHGGADLQLADHGAGGSLRPDYKRKLMALLLLITMLVRASPSWASRASSTTSTGCTTKFPDRISISNRR